MDLKIKDVADLLNVSETTIRRWLADGKIPAYKINHQYRFSRPELESWVLGQKLGQQTDATPFSENSQANEAPKEPHSGRRQFSLYRSIHKGGVLHDIPGETKEEIIRATMKRIANDLNLDADVTTELLIDRENLEPTSLNHGIGIPHTRDSLLREGQNVVTVVFPQNPIPYGALDGEPVHTLFFLFSCEDKRHLHLLAKIAHLCNQPETIALLRTKPPKNHLLDYIRDWEGKIVKI